MVVPALPGLQRELDTTTTWVTWVMTGFLLSAAVLTPILGKLGDRFGKERLLVLLAGPVPGRLYRLRGRADIWVLIFFRIVSGAAGAVFPLSFGIIRDEFPPERIKVGIGLLSAVFGVGGGLGLVLSGVIVDHVSWRWLFVVGRDRRRDRDRPRAPLRPRVARPVDLAHRRARRRADVRGAGLVPARALRGRELGMDVAGGARPVRALGRLAPCSGSCSSSTSTSR